MGPIPMMRSVDPRAPLSMMSDSRMKLDQLTMTTTLRRAAILCAAALLGPAACGSQTASVAQRPSPPDTAFVQLQHRGEIAMGVDQYTSAHRFDDTDTGGEIQLQRDPSDSAGVATIREHLRDITAAFQRGDFRIPGFVHARQVPGTEVMAARKGDIEYSFVELPGGGKVVITTRDPEAVAAIHVFLAFQRQDHRAPGHMHH